MNEYTETCEVCQAPFQWSTTEEPGSFMFKIERRTACPPCHEIQQAKAEEDRKLQREAEQKRFHHQALEKLDAEIQWETPALFRGTSLDHPKFNLRAWRRLKDWEPTQERPWLGLVGATGACKSRIAYLVAGEHLRRLTSHRGDWRCPTPVFYFVTAYEISETALAIFSNDKETVTAAKQYLNRLRSCKLLLIDDLGKGRMSPSCAGELFALIDQRYQHQLATIWTSNSTPEQIASGMSEDMGAPFAGRLNDSSLIIKFA